MKTNRLAANLALVSLVGFQSVLAIACNKCSEGAVCGDYNTVGPSAPATPTPTPVAAATPLDPCRVESIQVGWHSGAQLPSLGVGEANQEQLDATPFNAQGEVPKGCNANRVPTWSICDLSSDGKLCTPTTRANCQVIGTGYNPFLRGLNAGQICTVAAEMPYGSQTIRGLFTVSVR